MSGRRIRAMRADDVDAVVAIVAETDEDDAEGAAATFAAEGVEGHFVVTAEDDDAPFGVSGFYHVPATERTSWLSWTYLVRGRRRQGHGGALMEHVLERLRGLGCRKAFVKVSDHADPDDGALYAGAVRVYERLGFARELEAPHFYDANESLLIYGLLLDDEGSEESTEIASESAELEFVGLREIADTNGAYTFDWEAPRRSLLSRRVGRKSGGFDREDLLLGLEGVVRAGGRRVFLTFPSNLPSIHEPLRQAAFEPIGRLRDYYEPGLDELHFVHDLSGID